MPRHLKFKPSKNKSNEVAMIEMEFRFLSDRLSGPLTILHAASKYGLGSGKSLEKAESLVIHIVGSNIIGECLKTIYFFKT